MEKFCKRLIILFVILIAMFTLLSYFFVKFFISSNHSDVGDPPAEFNFESVTFKTKDNLNIKGWYTNTSLERKTVILLHGYKSKSFGNASLCKNIL